MFVVYWWPAKIDCIVNVHTLHVNCQKEQHLPSFLYICNSVLSSSLFSRAFSIFSFSATSVSSPNRNLQAQLRPMTCERGKPLSSQKPSEQYTTGQPWAWALASTKLLSENKNTLKGNQRRNCKYELPNSTVYTKNFI